VPGTVALGNLLGVAGFVECRIIEGDRAGIDRLAGLSRHHRHHRTRIDAAREEGTERHLRDHPQAHAFLQALDELRLRVFVGDDGTAGEANVPVPTRDGWRLPAAQKKGMAGRQLVSRAVDRSRIRHVAEREVVFDRRRIDLERQAAMGQQRLQLRAEHELTVAQVGVVKRLDAEAVAREEQRLLALVPDGEREHAAQALHAGLAPGLPGVDDDLGVAAGAEHVPERRQLGHQLPVVVDLAVVDDDHGAIGVEQRLLAALEVDDRQALVAERDPGCAVRAGLVGTPVMLRRVHAEQGGSVEVTPAARIPDTHYPAHAEVLAELLSHRAVGDSGAPVGSARGNFAVVRFDDAPSLRPRAGAGNRAARLARIPLHSFRETRPHVVRRHVPEQAARLAHIGQ
jgi:hypothetical protein